MYTERAVTEIANARGPQRSADREKQLTPFQADNISYSAGMDFRRQNLMCVDVRV